VIDQLKANEIKNIEVKFTEFNNMLDGDQIKVWIDGSEEYQIVIVSMKMNQDE